MSDHLTPEETDPDAPETLTSPDALVAARFAAEGVPVRVIARSFGSPSEVIRNTLEAALADGQITEIPRDDWPPTARRADRLPSAVAAQSDEDLTFRVMRAFTLTKLEASFMLILLKRDEADKATLHHAVESRRAVRPNQPDIQEETDPKMVDVIICKMRKRLKVHGIKIETMWGHGYFMDAANKAAALELMHPPELHLP
jgi:hypothetical protein